jgi:hypothetical protein
MTLPPIAGPLSILGNFEAKCLVLPDVFDHKNPLIRGKVDSMTGIMSCLLPLIRQSNSHKRPLTHFTFYRPKVVGKVKCATVTHGFHLVGAWSCSLILSPFLNSSTAQCKLPAI